MKKSIITILACYAIILTFINICYFYGKFIKAPYEAKKDRILQRPVYKDLVEEYTLLNKKIQEEVIVFAGDSITKRFNFCEYFPKKHIINRGIFHDTTFGLLKRLDKNINNLKIKKLFILIGHNDLRYRSNNDILKNMAIILSMAKAKTIYVQSILPVGKDKFAFNPRIKKLNTEFRKLCKKTGDHYIDLYKYFVDKNGRLKNEYSRDGLHPNGKGYEVWCACIKNFL